MSLDGLTPGERLMFHIGQVCQTHVWLDDYLRTAYRFMLPLYDPSRAVSARSTRELVAGCRRELESAAIPSHVRDASMGVLDAALAANEERNRVVHDLWLARLGEDGTGNGEHGWDLLRRDPKGLVGDLPSREADLDHVVSVRDALNRARLRAWALGMAVTETFPLFLPLYTEEYGATSQRDFWLPVMLDRFEVGDDGGVRVLPDA